MKTITVNLPERGYDILIGKGLLDQTGKTICSAETLPGSREDLSFRRIAIVTEPHVFSLYGERLLKSFEKSGIEPTIILVPQGEEAKDFYQLEKVFDEFAKAGLLRTDLIIAFGGGAVGDLTGFAAATYMRGVPYIQIPTTLLSQVDSSVGGKTAINLKQGKNLVGAFWQPKMVLVDPSLLESLSDRDFAGGMAEVIKYGAIASEELYQLLSNLKGRNEAMKRIEDIISQCCSIKAGIVEQDERDQGLRMTLNFGHTFGHGLEKIGHFNQYTHGEAVAIGMMWAIKTGVSLGITHSDCQEKVSQLLKQFSLPTSSEIKITDIVEEMLMDKKNVDDKIRLILIKTIGNSMIYETNHKALRNFAERGFENE